MEINCKSVSEVSFKHMTFITILTVSKHLLAYIRITIRKSFLNQSKCQLLAETHTRPDPWQEGLCKYHEKECFQKLIFIVSNRPAACGCMLFYFTRKNVKKVELANLTGSENFIFV